MIASTGPGDQSRDEDAMDGASLSTFHPAPTSSCGFPACLLHVVNVMWWLNELVFHLLFQIGASGAQLRQAIDHILHKCKRSSSFCTRMSKAVVIVPSSL